MALAAVASHGPGALCELARQEGNKASTIVSSAIKANNDDRSSLSKWNTFTYSSPSNNPAPVRVKRPESPVSPGSGSSPLEFKFQLQPSSDHKEASLKKKRKDEGSEEEEAGDGVAQLAPAASSRHGSVTGSSYRAESDSDYSVDSDYDNSTFDTDDDEYDEPERPSWGSDRQEGDTSAAGAVIPTLPRRSSMMFRRRSYDGSIGRLQTELCNAIARTRDGGYNGEAKGFVPAHQLEGLVCPQYVEEQLRQFGKASDWKNAARDAIANFNSKRKQSPKRDIRSQAMRISSGKRPDTNTVAVGAKKNNDMWKIFAVLMLIGKPCRIWSLFDEGLRDSDLPLLLVDVPGTKHKKRGSKALVRRGAPTTFLKCFKDWKPETSQRFEEDQWCVLAPKFHFDSRNPRAVKSEQFEDSRILPFTHWERIYGSSNCEVFKVRIHPQHHNFGDFKQARLSMNENEFAIKRLSSGDYNQYSTEVNILRRFNRHLHENRHLVPLLAAFEYRNCCHLVLPYAECDLANYWRANPNPKFDEETVRWYARQCRGLVKALKLIHYHHTSLNSSLPRPAPLGHVSPENSGDGTAATPTELGPRDSSTSQTNDRPSPAKRPKCSWGGKAKSRVLVGRHGDIKPSNVLWFSNPGYGRSRRGTLMISDFGTANLEARNRAQLTTANSTNSHCSTSVPPQFTATYRPPEHDLDRGDESSPVDYSKWDIWSLGCLFLEFTTWLLMGQDGVDEFSRVRTGPDAAYAGIPSDTFFWRRDVEVGGKVQRTTELRPAVLEWIMRLHSHRRCTDLVHNMLNIIRVDMLDVNSDERKTAGHIYKNMASKKDKLRDKDWCMKECPWKYDP